MKLHKLSLILLTTVVVLSFTSCVVEDYYWTEGRLDIQETVIANRQTSRPNIGAIAEDIRITSNQISVRGSRHAVIDDLRFTRGSIKLEMYGYVDYVDLTIRGTNRTLSFNVDGQMSIYDKSQQAQDFLNVLVEQIRRYGYATLMVDGQGDFNAEVDLFIETDLEVYIQD